MGAVGGGRQPGRDTVAVILPTPKVSGAGSRADYTQGGVTGLISERASGTSKYYHGDQLGSTRGITSAAQTITDSREYDSFGLTIATTGTTATPFGFVGGQGYRSDGQSGLQLLGARYYDASIGRFISRDPIGYAGGLNLYGYSGNDPVNGIDPTGHAVLLVAGIGLVALLTIITHAVIIVGITAIVLVLMCQFANYIAAEMASHARRQGPTPNPGSGDYWRTRPAGPPPQGGTREMPDAPGQGPTLEDLVGGPHGPLGWPPPIGWPRPLDKTVGPEMPGDIDGVGPW